MTTELLAQVTTGRARAGRVIRPGAPGELLIEEAGSATVLVVDHRVGDARAAVFLVRICDERAVPARRVLTVAGQMGAGALALVGGSYVVRFAIPAAQLQAVALPGVLGYVRDLAAALAAEFAAIAPRDSAAFAHLAS